MKKFINHYDPLRPNRALGISDRYEFTHGAESICIYDINTMDFIKEVKAGPRPDCHSTSLSNRWLYMACGDGLHILDQNTLEIAKVLYTGHVYGTNVMPDGETMLLHDNYGGIYILKDIEDIEKIRIYKRITLLTRGTPGYTLGGKGNFYENYRYYLVGTWNDGAVIRIDLEDDYSFERFAEKDPLLDRGDDLVISSDKTRAYLTCHRSNQPSHVAVIDIASRKVIKTIETGNGTCGLTMSNDERYAIASNDSDDSVTVIDTADDTAVSTLSARTAFEALGIYGYIQGISIGVNDEVYVYCCNGNGALVRFSDIITNPVCTVSWSGGQHTFDIGDGKTRRN